MQSPALNAVAMNEVSQHITIKVGDSSAGILIQAELKAFCLMKAVANAHNKSAREHQLQLLEAFKHQFGVIQRQLDNAGTDFHRLRARQRHRGQQHRVLVAKVIVVNVPLIKKDAGDVSSAVEPLGQLKRFRQRRGNGLFRGVVGAQGLK